MPADYYAELWKCFFLYPVHGGWSEWKIENDCTSQCQGTIKYTSRACDSPKPRFCGNHCGKHDLKLEFCSPSKFITYFFFSLFDVE